MDRIEFERALTFKYIGEWQVSFEPDRIYEALSCNFNGVRNDFEIVDESGDAYVWDERFVLANFVEIAEDGTEKVIVPLNPVMTKNVKVS